MRIFLLVLVANTVLNVEELVLLVECSTCDQEGDTEDDAVLDSVVEQFRSHVRQVGQEPERAVHIICVSRLLTNPSGVAREEQSHCDPDSSDCAEDQVDEPDLILRLLLDHRDAPFESDSYSRSTRARGRSGRLVRPRYGPALVGRRPALTLSAGKVGHIST